MLRHACFMTTRWFLSMVIVASLASASNTQADDAEKKPATSPRDFSKLPFNTWVKLSPLADTPVSPRLGYEGACVWNSVDKVMIRYGGHNQGGGGEQNAEVWTFEPRTAVWK